VRGEDGVVSAPAGVLIVGVYGSGKSSVCEEIAEVLESSGMAYGAIDREAADRSARPPTR
jgi:adenylate kinase